MAREPRYGNEEPGDEWPLKEKANNEEQGREDQGREDQGRGDQGGGAQDRGERGRGAEGSDKRNCEEPSRERQCKGKPGRPKGKPLSERERVQRRGAAWKTGEHARGTLARTVPPCKTATCPLGKDGYPCELKARADEEGKAVERCAPSLLIDEDVRAAYERALRDQDPSHLAPIVALKFGAMDQLASRQLALLLEEGLALEEDLFDKEGRFLASRKVSNPRAEPTLKLLTLLGVTADQQRISPKGQGEGKRDEGLGSLFTFLDRARGQLGE